MKFLLAIALVSSVSVEGFTPLVSNAVASKSLPSTTTALNGLFDNWSAGGSGNGKDDLDDQWAKQQEILKFRRSSSENKAKYFEDVSCSLLPLLSFCKNK